MQNNRYDFSPITSRAPFALPNGARVAVWVGINVEHFDIQKVEFGGVASFNANPPNVFDYAIRDYGNRVGFWRVGELLERYGIKASVLLNSDVCNNYPEIISHIRSKGWEFVGHGITNSFLVGGLSENEERAVVRASLKTIGKAAGVEPKGWLSPALQETFNTPDILAEEGIEYLCDWCCDDQPFPMKVRNGRLISIPYSVDINDFVIFIFQKMSPDEYCRLIKAHFDTLYREAVGQARVMCIGLHPFIIGQPHRIKALEEIIQYMKGYENVWFTRAGEIAQWYYGNYMTKTGNGH